MDRRQVGWLLGYCGGIATGSWPVCFGPRPPGRCKHGMSGTAGSDESRRQPPVDREQWPISDPALGQVNGLASKILAPSAPQTPRDWEIPMGVVPAAGNVVDPTRLRGTCLGLPTGFIGRPPDAGVRTASTKLMVRPSKTSCSSAGARRATAAKRQSHRANKYKRKA